MPEYQSLRQLIGAWAIEHGFYCIGQSGPSWLMVVHPEARETFVWLAGALERAVNMGNVCRAGLSVRTGRHGFPVVGPGW
jgi:hypothetical protein